MKIPAGTYSARAVAGSNSLDKSKNKGTDFVKVAVEITQEGFDEERLDWTGWLTEKAGERTIETLRLMGWTGEDIAESPMPGLGSTEFKVVVEGEEYNGNTYSKIKYVNPAGITGDDAKTLSDRWREKARAAKVLGKPDASSPKKTDAPALAADGDDIPF